MRPLCLYSPSPATSSVSLRTPNVSPRRSAGGRVGLPVKHYRPSPICRRAAPAPAPRTTRLSAPCATCTISTVACPSSLATAARNPSTSRVCASGCGRCPRRASRSTGSSANARIAAGPSRSRRVDRHATTCPSVRRVPMQSHSSFTRNRLPHRPVRLAVWHARVWCMQARATTLPTSRGECVRCTLHAWVGQKVTFCTYSPPSRPRPGSPIYMLGRVCRCVARPNQARRALKKDIRLQTRVLYMTLTVTETHNAT